MGVVDLGKIRGTMWYAGKVLNGTSSTPVVFPDSGISYAYADDLYANTDNGNLYVCITPGAADVATWSYIGCIEGPQPPLVNNLTTNSTTMALTAKMGKTLDEKINNAGLYPYEIIPMLTEPSFLLRMEIEDKATEITVIGEEEEGTYSVEPLGISDRQTVTVPLNTAIGFSKFGDVIRNVKSSNASIFSYVLYDENTQEQCNINLKLWDSLLDQIDNIRRKGAIAEGEDLYLTAEVSQVLDGERKALMPITHDAAVWHNKKLGITLHEKILSLVANLETLDASLLSLNGVVDGHTTQITKIEETLDGVPEQIAEVQNGVNLLNAKILDDLDDVIATTDEGFIAGALAVKQLNSNLIEKINVIYDPETDYIQVNYFGNIKNIFKAGFKTWTVYNNGVLDPNVALSSSGYNNVGVVQGSSYMTFNAPTSATTFTYNYYSFDLGDIAPWSQMTVSCSCDYAWAETAKNYNKIGLSTSRTTTPNIQVQIPQNSQITLNFNLAGLTGKHYLTFVTHCYEKYPAKSYCYSIVLS